MLHNKHIIKTLSTTIFFGMFLCLSFNIIKAHQPAEYKGFETTQSEINIAPDPEDPDLRID